MQQRTLGIIKPDGVSRRLTGEILALIEEAGLDIAALRMISMTKEQAQGFYQVHAERPFYDSLTDFMSFGPCVVMVLAGDDVINRYRNLMGATNYKEAEEGTIRKRYATDIERNVVHGSDSEESARFEIGYFFSALDLVRR